MTRKLRTATMDLRDVPGRPLVELHRRRPASGMSTSTQSQHALARWLLSTEVGAAEGLLADSAAAERVLHKLSQRLALLITPMGYDALLRRAVHVSRTEFPFLDGAMAAPNTDSLIDMLSRAAATAESSEAQEAFVTLIGTLVALLDLFIGERLTFRMLSEVWPELPMSQPVQSTRRNGTGKLEVNY